MKKLMTLALSLAFVGSMMMVSGCAPKQEDATQQAPAMEEAMPAATGNTEAAEQAIPAAGEAVPAVTPAQ